MALSFLLRRCLSFIVHIWENLASLDELLYLFLEFLAIVGLMPMVFVIHAVFRGVILFLRCLHLLGFRELTRIQLSIDLTNWYC